MSSEQNQPLAPPASPEIKRQMEEHAQIIRSLYDGDIPLFTKHGLRRAGQQLDQYAEGKLENNEMLIDNIKGNTIRVPIPGLLDLVFLAGHKLVVNRRPLIKYGTIQCLTAKVEFPIWNPDTAYLTLDPVYVYTSPNSNTTLSASKLEQLLKTSKLEWESTPQYAALATLVASSPVLSKARKIVGFALGPVVGPDSVGERDNCSLMQYCLLLSLRELVAARSSSSSSGSDEVRCFAQDPDLCPAAAEALQSAGVAVLDDPYAFTEVDDATVVVSISPNVPVKQVIAEIARPAAIMWLAASVDEEKGIRLTDPTSTKVEGMLENEYVDLNFPYYEPFRDITLYARKE
ncbi:hypothetical protein F4825DRAFT_470804 [Nemania diffusa]|nr:hypothetical protein F4825DRAFT_470804 [Nemania diffusa]